MRCLAGALLASGCLNPASTTCTSGDLTWVCPSGYACAEVGAYCGLTVQVDACAGKMAFDSCSFTDQSADTSGTCELGVCTACSAATQADLEGCTYADFLQMDAPASAYRSVWDIAPADAYAVGTATLLHYDGKSWSTPAGLPAGAGSGDLGGVWASGSNDVYVAAAAIANADLVHFDGTSWTLIPGSNSSETLDAVFGLSDHDVYAAGSRVMTGIDGTLRHFDGSSWSNIDIGHKPLTGVWASATRQVVVATGTGGGAVFRSDTMPTPWSEETPTMPSPMPPLRGVWGSADGDIYAVGESNTGSVPTMLHFDGSTWTQVLQCPDASATQCFDTSVSGISLFGIWGLAANDIYAVGDTGAVLHYDGQRWSAQTIAGSTTLRAIAGLANEKIVVGDQKILREAPP